MVDIRREDTPGTGIPYEWLAVTPSDTEDLTNDVCQALMVLTDASTVVAITANGTTTTFTPCPSGLIIPGEFTRVMATGTTGSIKLFAGYTR